jgi:hypothetical protein
MVPSIVDLVNLYYDNNKVFAQEMKHNLINDLNLYLGDYI